MEQRRQSTRQLVRRVSFLAAAFAVTAGLAVQGQMEAAAYRRYLANSRLHAFAELSANLSQLNTDLQKGVYATTPSMLGALCTQIFGRAMSAQMALGELPYGNIELEQTAAFLHSRIKIGCTGCRYCMPCPMGVDIPDNFSIWNKLGMFGQKDAIKAQWTTCFPDSEKALHCVRCGKCEAVCPQKLPIRDSLAQLQKELDAL